MAILSSDQTLAGAIVIEGGQGTMVLTLGNKEVPVKLGNINYPFTMPLGTQFKLPGSSFLIEDTDATPLGGADIFHEDNVNPGNYTIVSGDGKVTYRKGELNETNINLNTFQSALAVGTDQITYEGNAFAFIAGRSATASLIGTNPFHITNDHDTDNSEANDRATATEHPVIRGGKGTALLTDSSEDRQFTSPISTVGGETTFDVGDTILSVNSLILNDSSELTQVTYTLDTDGGSLGATEFSFSGSTITIGTALAIGDSIEVIYEVDADDFEVKVRLDELSYPFTLSGSEVLRPVGASFIYASRS